jgi:hypothetical protein
MGIGRMGIEGIERKERGVQEDEKKIDRQTEETVGRGLEKKHHHLAQRT